MGSKVHYESTSARITFPVNRGVLRECACLVIDGTPLSDHIQKALSGGYCYTYTRTIAGYRRKRDSHTIRLTFFRWHDAAALADAVQFFREAAGWSGISGRARCRMGERGKRLMEWWKPNPVDLLASLEVKDGESRAPLP